MYVRDSTVGRGFYGAVLGWRFRPGGIEGSWSVEDIVPRTGMGGGRERSVIVPQYQVDNIHAAVERVRARGGVATDVATRPYGLVSECQDDQGARFYLGQPLS